jgi:hypothetical protein
MVAAENPLVHISILPLRMTLSLVKMNVYHVGCFAGFLAMWPILPGTFGFLFASFGATLPLYLFIGREAWEFVRQRNELEAHLTQFDAANAQCAVPSDKDLLISDLGRMWAGSGGISGFNRLVRTDIKQTVLSQLVNDRTVLSFRSALIATCPTIPFFIGNHHSQSSAWTPLAQLCHALFAVSHVLAVFPGALVFVATLASRQEEQLAGTQTLSWARLILCSTVGAGFITLFNVFAYLIPIGLALGSFPQLSDTPWHGIGFAVVANTCFVLPILWLFFGGRRKLKRQASLLGDSFPVPDGETCVAQVPSDMSTELASATESLVS